MPTHRVSLFQRLAERLSFRLIPSRKLPKTAVAPFMRRLALRGFYPTNILDIGANRGRWSEKTSWVFAKAAYTLVEPQPEMREHLERFCSRHPGSRWVNAGVAAEMGELPFTLTGPTSSTFTFSPEEAARLGFGQRLLPVVTVDHLCAEVIRAVPEIVKVDAEGFEFEILKGAKSVLGAVELFLLELPFFQPRPKALSFREAVAQMGDYGYELYDFTAFQKRPYDDALGQCEAVFARRDGILRSFKGWK